jgi:hypothetical protein
VFASVVGPVAGKSAQLAATEQPTVTGTATAGQTLTASTGTWTGTPTGFTYAWQRCNENGRICTAIDGATNATYTVTAADSGHALLAVVQATEGASKQASWSTATVPVV